MANIYAIHINNKISYYLLKSPAEALKIALKRENILGRVEASVFLANEPKWQKLFEDLKAIEERKNEPTVSFEEVASKLAQDKRKEQRP